MWKKLQRGLAELNKAEQEQLHRVFQRLDINKDGVICMEDLAATMKELRYEPQKGELEEMIWEVDETLDKTVTYDEFVLMYRRVRSDDTMLEPRALYNVVDFMVSSAHVHLVRLSVDRQMNDYNCDGKIDVDEATQLMYLRAGKTIDEHSINEFLTKLFKGNLDNDSTVNFYDYLDFVEGQKHQDPKGKKLEAQRSSFSNSMKKGTKS